MKTTEKLKSTPERWVSARDLAAHWNRPLSWVRRHAKRIPHVRPMGVGNYRFRISEADAWLEKRRGGEQI